MKTRAFNILTWVHLRSVWIKREKKLYKSVLNFPSLFQTDQGIKNLSPQTAQKLGGTNPDYAIRDLYDNIAKGNFPSWTFYIQVMTFEEAETYKWNPFDVTKVGVRGI